MKNRMETATAYSHKGWGLREEDFIGIRLKGYDHIAFDLDGVLVDSEAVVETALRRWAQEEGICPDYTVRMSAARRDIELVAAIAPGLCPEREAARIADYEIQAMKLLQPIQGAAEFYGSIPFGRRSIVTSSARISALARLDAAGIPHPKILIAAEDVSQGKPNPQPYRTLLRMLGITPERCLVFEDSLTGIEAATAAGCDCIGVGLNAKGHPETKGWIEHFREIFFPAGLAEPAFQIERRDTP